MDLPPPITQQPRAVVQNRPSIGYLIFISLLFYLISNNSTSSSPPPDADTASSELARLRNDLLRRVQRRDGLAKYLGLNSTKAQELPAWSLPAGLVFNASDAEAAKASDPKSSGDDSAPANVTLYEPIPFEPAGGSNKAITPFVQPMVDNTLGEALYAQNVTGFVKGTWAMRDFSLAELGLDETYNTTREVEREVEEGEHDKEEGSQGVDEAGAGRVVRRGLSGWQQARPRAAAQFQRRAEGGVFQPVNAADSVVWSQDNNTLPVYHIANETVVHNRTADRGPYPWSKGGKLTFNLREERQFAWGYAGEEEGHMALLASGKDDWEGQGPVTFLSGDLTFTSFDGQNDLIFDIEAGHFLSQGSVYGYASPQNDRRSQLFNVPGLAIVDDASTSPRGKIDAMGRMVVAQIDRRIEQDQREIEEHTEGRFPAQVDNTQAGPFAVDAAPCIFAFFGQLAPLPHSYSPEMYLEYYRSLLRPQGSSLAPPPAPRLEYTLYSENCGLVLEGEGTGLSSYRLWEQATSYATLMALVQGLLLVLLVRQIEWGGASAGGRVAYLTVGLQAAIDSYFFVVHFTVGVATRNRSSLPLLVPAFFALLSSVIFGMRYASSIRASQPAPHRPPPPPPPPPSAPPPMSPLTDAGRPRAAEEASGEAGSNARVRAEAEEDRRAQREAGEEEERDDDAEAEAQAEREFREELAAAEALLSPRPGELPPAAAAATATAPVANAAPPPALLQIPPAHELGYVGLALGVGVAVFIFIMTAGWLPFILVLVYSYWLPQLVLNTRRGSARNSLRPEFVVGTTAARLALPLYFWSFANNVLSVEPSRWVWLLVLYSALQAAVLVVQGSGAGARWFLPGRARRWLEMEEEERWDYHPQELSAQAEENAREEACAICLEKVEVPGKEERELKRGRVGYMVPPCNHIAHTECLTGWMEVKSVCPVCRGRLPPM